MVEKIFKYVIIGSGIYSKRWSPLKNIEAFQGEIIHSGDYKEPSIFKDKRVVVVGNGISSTDICSEALETCTSLTQIFRSKYIILNFFSNGIPLGFYLNSLKRIFANNDLFASNDVILESLKLGLQVYGNPGVYNPLLQINDVSEIKGFIVSDERYTNGLSSGGIQIVEGEAVEFCNNGIMLRDGQIIEADIIVLATGFHRKLDYLGKSIKNIIKYCLKSFKKS